MKKITIISLLFIVLVLSSCNLPEKVTEEMVRTSVASTLQAKINFIGSQTPPTPTATNTVLPTETPTPTITLTPTLAPTATWTYHEAGSAQILILYYHEVINGREDDAYYQWEIDNPGGPYVRPVEFEQQVRILKEMNYTPITLADMVKVLREGGELPERPVMLTFDDTEMGVWKNVYPIMKKYGFIGNLLIQANHVDAKNSMSSDQIKEMLADGWDIGSAGNYGNGLTRETWSTEIAGSKQKLKELFDREITVFAYPGGYTDPEGEIIRRTMQYGYLAALAGNLRSIDISADRLYYIPRFEMTQGITYNQFFEMLPWKEGSISRETMEWTLPTPTLEPEFVEMTKQAVETLMADPYGDEAAADEGSLSE